MLSNLPGQRGEGRAVGAEAGGVQGRAALLRVLRVAGRRVDDLVGHDDRGGKGQGSAAASACADARAKCLE